MMNSNSAIGSLPITALYPQLNGIINANEHQLEKIHSGDVSSPPHSVSDQDCLLRDVLPEESVSPIPWTITTLSPKILGTLSDLITITEGKSKSKSKQSKTKSAKKTKTVPLIKTYKTVDLGDQYLSQEVWLETFNSDNLPFIFRHAPHSNLLLSKPRTVTTTDPAIFGTLGVFITESGESKSENAEKAKAAPFIKATGTAIPKKKGGVIKAHNAQFREGEWLYICEIKFPNGKVCNKIFKYPGSLTKHQYQAIHTENPLHVCDICDKHFSKKFDFIAHKRTHTSQPYLCITCNKRFQQLIDLASHMYHHTESPDICTECGIGFSDRNIFQDHEHAHAKEKPISCDTCKKRFVSPSALITHERTHTGDKPYICLQCNKGFSQKSTLLSHMVLHNPGISHACSVCGKSYKWKSSLKYHQIKKHSQITY